jgi:NSS family neurotransmitter:Na+ symporter
MAQQKSFSSNLGAIMAAVGSAVGLGNIWRFPYICGKYGGGAFLIVYLCFVFLLGSVLMMSEFVIGRRAQHTPIKAFQSLYPKNKAWGLVGLLGIITSFFILSQYLVISGWTTGYVWNSISGTLASLGTDSGAISNFFNDFSTSQWDPVLFLSIFAVLALLIILGGVQKGIENVSKVLMPVLVVLVLVLCVRSLTLPGAGKGVEYLFLPDFSKLTGEGVLAALGQALFSLSVGMGVLLVYGSYIPVNDNIFKTAMWITACDTLIAVLAGLAIFPAVFSCGFEPAGGPGLVFHVLPNVFNMMGTTGMVFASIFFILLMVAAITSAISLLEALTAWFSEHTGTRRWVGALLFFVLTTALGILFSLSMGSLSHVKIAGLCLFDFVDRMNSIYLPPLCALGTIIFFGG